MSESEKIDRIIERLNSGERFVRVYINPSDKRNVEKWPIAKVFAAQQTPLVFSNFVPVGNFIIQWKEMFGVDQDIRLPVALSIGGKTTNRK